ncbi:hypothetical protein NC651_032285 [Populus alba x Populus x berolinensis]|nr:hypothetical protein NC651_032285 [Populus alba x Populus x berolinensis]
MIEKGMKGPQLDYNKFATDFSRAGKPVILEELAQKMKFSGKFEVSNVFDSVVAEVCIDLKKLVFKIEATAIITNESKISDDWLWKRTSFSELRLITSAKYTQWLAWMGYFGLSP